MITQYYREHLGADVWPIIYNMFIESCWDDHYNELEKQMDNCIEKIKDSTGFDEEVNKCRYRVNCKVLDICELTLKRRVDHVICYVTKDKTLDNKIYACMLGKIEDCFSLDGEDMCGSDSRAFEFVWNRWPGVMWTVCYQPRWWYNSRRAIGTNSHYHY